MQAEAAGRSLWQWYLELEDQGALTTACKINPLWYGTTLKGVVSDLVFSTKTAYPPCLGIQCRMQYEAVVKFGSTEVCLCRSGSWWSPGRKPLGTKSKSNNSELKLCHLRWL